MFTLAKNRLFARYIYTVCKFAFITFILISAATSLITQDITQATFHTACKLPAVGTVDIRYLRFSFEEWYKTKLLYFTFMCNKVNVRLPSSFETLVT